MKRIFTNIQKEVSKLMLLTVLAGAIASCDSVLDYEDGDCDIKYRVKFKYDYNMEKVDAFAQNVKSVTLYAFDDEGNFVYQKTDQGEPLADGSYAMDVDIDPQKYHLVTWAGLDNESFAVPVMNKQSEIEDLTVLTLRDAVTRAAEGDEGKYIVKKKNLSPLWHGEAIKGKSVLYTTPATGNSVREEVTTLGLMKNTNNIRIVVAQVNQHPDTEIPTARAIKDDMFTYAIYDDNGKMNYDNSLMEDVLLTYEPFVTETDKVTTRAFSAAAEEANTYPAAVAEISIARLVETQNPKLKIYNKENETELLPDGSLIRYLGLLKEQNCIDMPLQEYFDREDNYGMVFFVDENLTLIKTVIQINDWVININDFEL